MPTSTKPPAKVIPIRNGERSPRPAPFPRPENERPPFSPAAQRATSRAEMEREIRPGSLEEALRQGEHEGSRRLYADHRPAIEQSYRRAQAELGSDPSTFCRFLRRGLTIAGSLVPLETLFPTGAEYSSSVQSGSAGQTKTYPLALIEQRISLLVGIGQATEGRTCPTELIFKPLLLFYGALPSLPEAEQHDREINPLQTARLLARGMQEVLRFYKAQLAQIAKSVLAEADREAAQRKQLAERKEEARWLELAALKLRLAVNSRGLADFALTENDPAVLLTLIEIGKIIGNESGYGWTGNTRELAAIEVYSEMILNNQCGYDHVSAQLAAEPAELTEAFRLSDENIYAQFVLNLARGLDLLAMTLLPKEHRQSAAPSPALAKLSKARQQVADSLSAMAPPARRDKILSLYRWGVLDRKLADLNPKFSRVVRAQLGKADDPAERDRLIAQLERPSQLTAALDGFNQLVSRPQRSFTDYFSQENSARAQARQAGQTDYPSPFETLIAVGKFRQMIRPLLNRQQTDELDELAELIDRSRRSGTDKRPLPVSVENEKAEELLRDLLAETGLDGLPFLLKLHERREAEGYKRVIASGIGIISRGDPAAAVPVLSRSLLKQVALLKQGPTLLAQLSVEANILSELPGAAAHLVALYQSLQPPTARSFAAALKALWRTPPETFQQRLIEELLPNLLSTKESRAALIAQLKTDPTLSLPNKVITILLEQEKGRFPDLLGEGLNSLTDLRLFSAGRQIELRARLLQLAVRSLLFREETAAGHYGAAIEELRSIIYLAELDEFKLGFNAATVGQAYAGLLEAKRFNPELVAELLDGQELVVTTGQKADSRSDLSRLGAETLLSGLVRLRLGKGRRDQSLKLTAALISRNDLWRRMVKKIGEKNMAAVSDDIQNLIQEARRLAGVTADPARKLQGVKDPFSPEILSQALNKIDPAAIV